MALRIINGKVVNISPPQNLTKKQQEDLENAPINKELIKKATSRKYNVIEA